MFRLLSWIPGIYPTRINGLRLPKAYLRIERMGRWHSPSLNLLESVFGEPCTTPFFYGRDDLSFENRDLVERISNDDYFLGTPDSKHRPGNIDPSQVIFIGDLGRDRPIALDYRLDSGNPSVIYLRMVDSQSRWVHITSSFEDLARKLQLLQ